MSEHETRDGDAERHARSFLLADIRLAYGVTGQGDIPYLLREIDARDAALRDARAEIERLKAVAEAARPIAAAAADLLASTQDRSEIWELPAAMSITAGDLRRLEKALVALGETKP